jgi:hypothetical protein
MTERMTPEEIESLKLRRMNRRGETEVICSKAYAEIMALKAEIERLTPKRLCVMCGKEAPADQIPHNGEHPDCPEAIVDGENFGRLCMFDMTDAEAFNYWRGKAHEQREEIHTLRKALGEKAAS